MKKIISLIAVFTVLISINTFMVFADSQAYLNIYPDKNGSEVTYIFSLSGYESLSGVNLRIYFDEKIMTPKFIERGEILKGGFLISNLQNQSFDLYSEGYISAIWMGVNPIKENGELFTITFNLDKNVKKLPELVVDGTISGKASEHIPYVVTKSSVLTPTDNSEVTKKVKCKFSSQNIYVDGEKVNLEAYNIDGYNYYKLRDIAFLMNDTPNAFSVTSINDTKEIYTYRWQNYNPIGGELTVGQDKSSLCIESNWLLKVNAIDHRISVYNIGGSNFFKLRDLGNLFGFSVNYDNVSNSVIVNSK